jgi:selenium-binding protein 1
MATWTPDPTFYPSPRLATQAPPEKLAYVASLDPTRKRPDVMAVVGLDSESAGYGRIVHGHCGVPVAHVTADGHRLG